MKIKNNTNKKLKINYKVKEKSELYHSSFELKKGEFKNLNGCFKIVDIEINE